MSKLASPLTDLRIEATQLEHTECRWRDVENGGAPEWRRHPPSASRQQEIVTDGKRLKHIARLKGTKNAPSRDEIGLTRMERLLLNGDVAGAWSEQPRHDVDQTGFASAVGADEAMKRPGRHGQVDTLEDGKTAERQS